MTSWARRSSPGRTPRRGFSRTNPRLGFRPSRCARPYAHEFERRRSRRLTSAPRREAAEERPSRHVRDGPQIQVSEEINPQPVSRAGSCPLPGGSHAQCNAGILVIGHTFAERPDTARRLRGAVARTRRRRNGKASGGLPGIGSLNIVDLSLSVLAAVTTVVHAGAKKRRSPAGLDRA